jgi:hypothetical protein
LLETPVQDIMQSGGESKRLDCCSP